MRVPTWAKVLAVALGLLGLVSAGVLWGAVHLLLAGGPMKRCKGHERFDATLWRDSAATLGPLAVRGCMVDNFLATHPLRGARREAVIAWLGEPRPTPYFREYDLVYWLGPERSPMSIDSEWLVIRFDTSHRVEEFRLTTD